MGSVETPLGSALFPYPHAVFDLKRAGPEEDFHGRLHDLPRFT